MPMRFPWLLVISLVLACGRIGYGVVAGGDGGGDAGSDASEAGPQAWDGAESREGSTADVQTEQGPTTPDAEEGTPPSTLGDVCRFASAVVVEDDDPIDTQLSQQV